MDRQTPRYRKDVPVEELPKKVEKPNLRVCQIIESSRLSLPRDVRQLFMQDAVWSPEWRELLLKFDEHWGPVANSGGGSGQQEGPSGSTAAPAAASGNSIPGVVKQEVKEETFDWDNTFKDEPDSLEKIKAKFGAENLVEIPAVGNSSFILVPGPFLFLLAKEALVLKQWAAPIITHGAGVWLLGEKAKKFATNNPGKGVPCSWSDDTPYVVLEDLCSKFGL